MKAFEKNIRKVEPYVPGEQPQRKVIKLNTNENPYPPAPGVTKALEEMDTDRFRLYTQVYDFDDTKVKLGGELKINDNFSLLGEQTDLRHGSKSNTYVGVRTYF